MAAAVDLANMLLVLTLAAGRGDRARARGGVLLAAAAVGEALLAVVLTALNLRAGGLL